MTSDSTLPGERDLTAEGIRRLTDESVRLIVEQQLPNGALPASPSFSAYTGYCWFRDGSFIADAMSAYGQENTASRFFDWCSGVLTSRREQIETIVARSGAGRPVADDQMLPARFTFNGGDGVEDWWDFQLDGYGTWLWAVVEHSRRSGLPLDRWDEAIRLTVDYLLSSWDRPCYDWWEEHSEAIHVSTLGCIASGLGAVLTSGLLDPDRVRSVAATIGRITETILDRGVQDGHLVKWLDGQAVDASLLAVIAPLGAISPTSPLGLATIDEIDRQLTVGHGVHRYLDDTFFGGGQWPLLSCFLGLAYSASGRTDRAQELLTWAAGTATRAFALPEQVQQHLLAPQRQQEWVDRWGPVATPLLWSHAMFVRLALDLGFGLPEGGEPA